jgi:hypothetical protein
MADTDLTVSAKQREKMPSSAFGDPKNRAYPIHDACLHGDTLIDLCDGQTIPIRELVGFTVPVLAYDPEQGIVVALATDVRKTLTGVDVVRVTLDNGESVVCTPDHRFMLRDGSYREAGQLTPGTSLMPSDNASRIGYTERDVERQIQSSKGLESKAGKQAEDCGAGPQKTSQGPGVGSYESSGLETAQFGARKSQRCRERAQTQGGSDRQRATVQGIQSSEAGEVRGGVWPQETECLRYLSEGIKQIKDSNSVRSLPCAWSLPRLDLRSLQQGFGSGEGFTGTTARTGRISYPRCAERSVVANHKVVSVDPAGKADVYDLSVDALHNFALACGVFVHNSHVRNAAARLEQQKSSMPATQYNQIRARIARAAKKFGIDSEYNKKPQRSSFRGSGRGLRMTTVHADGTRTEIRHMSAFCSEDGDKLWLAVPFDKGAALADGDENKRVWVQIARAGRWLGHRQGAFALNSQTFEQICTNFETQKVGRLQYDFEHASEQKPSDGAIPMLGAPAQGWIYALKHDGQRLFALTEWGDLARQYIQNDQYSGVSPAINWNQKDRVTGKPIGAVLSSVAITNKPFLTQMEPLAATSLALEEESESIELSGSSCCYSADEYLPRIKSALRLHDLSTPAQMSEALDNLREHMDAAEGDHTKQVNGVRLQDYALPLRNVVNAHAGMSWDEVFDVVEDLIDVAMDKHIIEDHPEDTPVESSMSNATEPTSTISETTPFAEATSAASTLTNQGGPAMAEVKPEKTVQEFQLEITNLTGERNQLKVDLEAALAVNSELSAKVEAHELQLLSAEVDTAYQTYEKKMGLTLEMKPVMLSVAKQNLEGFHKLYPVLPLPQRHLMSVLTGDGRTTQTTQLRVQADNAADAAPTLKPAELVTRIMKETNCSLLDAQCRVDAMLTKMQRRAG